MPKGLDHEYSNPVDRFEHLPEETRRWLERLRPSELEKLELLLQQDTKRIEEIIRLFQTALTVGKFTKWTIVTFVGILIITAQFSEAVVKLFKWITTK